MINGFQTIVVKTIIDGKEERVIVNERQMNSTSFVQAIRKTHSKKVKEAYDKIVPANVAAAGGPSGGLVFPAPPPPPPPDPIIPDITMDFDVPNMTLSGTQTNASSVLITISENGAAWESGEATLTASGWSYPIVFLNFLDGATYTAYATAVSSTLDTDDVTDTETIPMPPPPPPPPPAYADFIQDPNLVLFGNDAYIEADGTLSTNWANEAYPYSYAYVLDNNQQTYDLEDEMTIVMGRKTHLDETDAFGLLASKYGGNGGTHGIDGYELATYVTYFFGYLDDKAVDSLRDAVLMFGLGATVKDTWEHYALTFNKATGTVQIFKDGSYKTQKTGITEWPTDTSLSTMIGAKNGNSPTTAISPYRAKWRDVRFYKRILSDSEINQLSTDLNRT